MGDFARHRLRLRYVETMPRKIETLTDYIETLEAGDTTGGSTQDGFKNARAFAHQLAGSAGGYGFADIGVHARAAEQAQSAQFVDTLKVLRESLETAYAQAAAAAHQTVLVVEDDEDMIPLLELAARGAGDSVVVARTAREAEEVLLGCRVGVILLDLLLPDRDGREVLKWIRENPTTSHTPVVVLSAQQSPAVKRDCIAMGVDHYLEKPIDQELVTTALAAAFARARHFDIEARRDPLTKVKNRVGFRESVTEIRSLSSRASLQASLAVLDLDHFKSVNDTYGHGMGDVVLKETAQFLRDRLRISDSIGRWGGEEFLIAFPDTRVAGAVQALKGILADLKTRRFVHGDDTLDGVSFSAGVVPLSVEGELDDVVDDADRLLYLAKSAGRSRVFGPEQASASTTTPTVLLAEDDPDAAALVKAVLQGEGYRVRWARDGREALELAHSENVDAFVLDWYMPTLSGDMVLEALRNDPLHASTPVVMLTALGDDDCVTKAFSLGADDYVQKPFRQRVFAARMRRLLGGAPQTKETS